MMAEAFGKPMLDYEKIPEPGYERNEDPIGSELDKESKTLNLVKQRNPLGTGQKDLEEKWGPFDEDAYRKQIEDERLEKERYHNKAFIGISVFEDLIKKYSLIIVNTLNETLLKMLGNTRKRCLTRLLQRSAKSAPAEELVRHQVLKLKEHNMTPKKFYDWQTAGGTNDVMRLIDCLERADLEWCAIGGVAVNHWASEPMVTQDVHFVVAAESVELAKKYLEEAGFKSERFAWSSNFRGQSKVAIQLSAEDFYRDFPSRSVPADIHGILMRVASLEDTLRGKVKAWRDTERRQSKSSKILVILHVWLKVILIFGNFLMRI